MAAPRLELPDDGRGEAEPRAAASSSPPPLAESDGAGGEEISRMLVEQVRRDLAEAERWREEVTEQLALVMADLNAERDRVTTVAGTAEKLKEEVEERQLDHDAEAELARSQQSELEMNLDRAKQLNEETLREKSDSKYLLLEISGALNQVQARSHAAELKLSSMSVAVRSLQENVRRQRGHHEEQSERFRRESELLQSKLSSLRAQVEDSEIEAVLHEERAAEMQQQLEIIQNQKHYMQSLRERQDVEKEHSKAKVPVSSQVPDGIVAIAFCDIIEASELWEARPDEMAAAIDIYSQVGRDCLRASKGYEVKLESDVFMAAFHSSLDAVRWAMHIQEALVAADWPQLLATQDACKDVLSEDGRLLFHGPRVRCGINSGSVKVEMNPVTGRADYFGNSVNRAARVVTLGRGGETLVTDSVFFEVESDAMFRQTLFATYHGQHKLRGFDDETTVFSLLPKTLQDREQYLAKDSNKDTKTSDTKTSRVLAAWEAPTPNSSVGASEILQKKKKGPQKDLVDASAVLQDIDDTIVEGAEMTMRTALPSVDEAKRERQRQLKSNMEELIAEVQNTETLRDQLRSDNHTREKRLKQSRERVGSMMLEIKAKEKRLFSEIRRQLVLEQRSDRATQRVNATNNEADMTEHKSKALNEERQQLHEWIMETAVYANRNDKDDGDSRYLAQIQESTAEAKRSAESLAKVEQDHAEQLTQLDAIRAEMAVYERKQGLEAASKVEAYRALIQAENGSENMLKLISGAQLELELIKTEKERQGEEITRLGSLIALAKSPEQLAAVLNDPSLTRGDGSKEAADSVYQAKAAQFQLKDLRKTFRAEMTSKGETLAALYRLLARSVMATQSLRSVILGEYASIRPLSGRRAIEKQMTVMHQTSSTVRFADESQSTTPRSPQTRSPRTPRKRSPSQSPQVARSPKGTEKSQPTQVAVVPFSDTGGALRSEESSFRRTGSRHVARRNRAKSTGDARPRSVGTINMQARKGRAEVVKTEAAMASPRYLSARGDHKPAERRLPAVRDRRKVEAELHLITTDDWFSTSET